MLETTELIIRIIAATFAGLAVGFARKREPAGMRTFALICIGATLFTLIAVSNFSDSQEAQSRVIGNIIAGIGFLGIGVIWKTEKHIGGLTTAAAVWVVASIGILIGFAMWEVSLVSIAITMGILYSKPVEEKFIKEEEKIVKKKLNHSA